MRFRDIVAVGSLLAAGVAGSLVAFTGRDADPVFLERQRNPDRLSAQAVNRVVRTAPDPQVGSGSGISATCRPTGTGALRNPWTCTVRYASGARARLLVEVRPDGSYIGRYRVGGTAEGCCVATPAAG